ncbi:MAG: Rieske (2Fe-2S) protein [Bryobacteraceae bacterium]
MPFVKVGSLRELPPGSVLEANFGDDSYAVCNLGGEIHALGGICPHAGGPLGQGMVHDNMLVCPWHSYEYDIRSGENDEDSDMKVGKFSVRVEGGDILIDIPRAGTA